MLRQRSGICEALVSSQVLLGSYRDTPRDIRLGHSLGTLNNIAKIIMNVEILGTVLIENDVVYFSSL